MRLHGVFYVLTFITITRCSESDELDLLLNVGVCVKENSNSRNPPIKVPAVDYKDLVENSYIFVDKTLLARSIFKTRTSFMLLTYPRKWGKSMNLHMLKLFLQMKVHQNGTQIPVEDTWSYKFFTRGEIIGDGNTEKLKNPPLIAQYPDIIETHLAKYTVLHVDLRKTIPPITDNTHLRFEDFFKALQKTVSEVFAEHVYLMQILENNIAGFRKGSRAHNDTETQLIRFKKYLSQEEHDQEAMRKSLEFLASVAFKCFSRLSIVLIDNYDVLVNAINFDFPNQIDFREIPKIATFCVEFIFRSLESNKFAYKGVITGVFPAVIRYQYKIALRLKYYNTLAINLHPFHGFTKREIDQLFGHLHMNRTDIYNDVEQWYGGYKIDDYPRVKVFNPWSIVNFVNEKKIANYTSTLKKFRIFDHIFGCKEVRDFFEAIVSRSAQVAIHTPDLIMLRDDIGQVHHMVAGVKKSEEAKRRLHLLFLFFYMYGYVTLDYDNWIYVPGNILVQPVFPNNEMKSEVLQQLMSYYSNALGPVISNLTQSTAKLLVEFIESKGRIDFLESDLQENLHFLYYQHLSTKLAAAKNASIQLNHDKVYYAHFLTLLYVHLHFNYSIGVNLVYYEEEVKYRIPYIILYNDNFGAFINFNYGSHYGTWLTKDTGQLWQNLNKTKKFTNFFATKSTVKYIQFMEFFVPLDSRYISLVTDSLLFMG